MPSVKAKKKNPDKYFLYRTEFYNTYGISLCLANPMCDDQTRSYLTSYVKDIAKKYIDITSDAIQDELKYARHGGPSWSTSVGDKVCKKYSLAPSKIKNKTYRKKIDFETARKLFNQIKWSVCYGGKKWGAIADGAHKLKKLLPVTPKNLEKVLAAIDYLNDLEHNCTLYLADYSSFGLWSALEHKEHAKPNEIFSECSSDIAKIGRDLYRYHKEVL